MEAAEQTVLLTNRCDYDEPHLTAALGELLRGQRKKQNIVLVIAAAMLLVYCVIAWFKFHDSLYLVLSALTLVLAAAVVWMIRIMPARLAKKQAAKLRETSDGLSYSALFRADGIGFSSPKGQERAAVPYSVLSRVAEPTGLILLITVQKQMILLDPKRFEGGTEADFWRLMNEKCPNALPASRRA